jgi:hypothetical protein
MADRIREFVRAGAYDWLAAQATGIDQRIFYRWMERGARAGRGRYRQFRQFVLEAKARAKAELEVFTGHPLRWFLCGPGRDRPGEAGRSRQSTVAGAPTTEPLEVVIR